MKKSPESGQERTKPSALFVRRSILSFVVLYVHNKIRAIPRYKQRGRRLDDSIRSARPLASFSQIFSKRPRHSDATRALRYYTRLDA